MNLEEFKDNLAKDLYGMTKSEAHFKGICIRCGEPALPKCYTEAGRREYQISGLCESCFDQNCGEERQEQNADS